jgi:endonuclease-3 related protein
MAVTKEELILKLYKELFARHGPQGWWPILSRANERGFDDKGYHPSIYQYPISRNERYEIVVGAILTQNTAWKNVEKALSQLFKEDLLSPEMILECKSTFLSQLIRPAGYHNQKAAKLKHITNWFVLNDALIVKEFNKVNDLHLNEFIYKIRKKLLNVHGVGPETADSILLYAYHLPIFVVDGYTKRLFQMNRICNLTGKGNVDYQIIQESVHRTFSDLDIINREVTFNEFHALLVEEGKSLRKSVRKKF